MKPEIELDKNGNPLNGMVKIETPEKFSKWAIIYYKNGLRHREDGPAYEDDLGHFEWYKNGKCHREDGPAVYNLCDMVEGSATIGCEYFLNDKSYPYHEWLKKVKSA